MNLNDLARFAELDKHHMRAHIEALPSQLEECWKHAHTLPLPAAFKRAERVVIAAAGDDGIAADLVVALVADMCNIPIIVNRNYEMPAYADGQSTLVVALSHDGDTAEVLAAADLADARGTKLMAITQPGKLAAQVEKVGGTVWAYQYAAPTRAALGWTFGLLLALVARMGLISDISGDVSETVDLLRRHVLILGPDAPVVKNSAKRLAGQMIGRTPIIYGAGLTAPVAQRWKTQLNLNGKTLAQWEELPNLNHNVLGGMVNPKPLMTKVALVFLVAEDGAHPHLAQRWDLTRSLYLEEGLASDTVKARGKSRLAQMLSTVQFGDYVSYYVAMAYEVDPTETPLIAEMQQKLSQLPTMTRP